MAQVHDNGMVAHIWAHASQESARSHNGNFWFEGDTIYSYRTPLARIHVAPNGDKIALRTSETYSVTTSGKHEPAISRALNYGCYIKDFSVPSIGIAGGRLGGSTTIDHAANVAFLVKAYEDAKGKTRRARELWQSVDASLLRPYDELKAYCDTFEIAFPDVFLQDDIAAIVKFRADREAKNATPAAIAKREKARESAERRKAEKARIEALNRFEREKEMRTRWLEGGSIWGGTIRTATNGPLLRVKGDNLETSLGATVPLSHAVKAFRFVKLVRESGKPWSRNGKTVRVGHFQVDAIDIDGNMRAGCHFIEWPEIERIARAIGVFDDVASDEAVISSAHVA